MLQCTRNPCVIQPCSVQLSQMQIFLQTLKRCCPLPLFVAFICIFFLILDLTMASIRNLDKLWPPEKFLLTVSSPLPHRYLGCVIWKLTTQRGYTGGKREKGCCLYVRLCIEVSNNEYIFCAAWVL